MQLEVVPLEPTVKLIMPNEVLDKIKFLCKNIAKVEWSGILFYSLKGTIKDVSKMVITLEDILPMDMGSSAYTAYDIDDRYVEYLMDNPKAEDWFMGHIHSHHSMGVFFSGTDMSELNDNSESHNFYLSLIVNNFMDFMAKVAFRGEIDHEIDDIPYQALDEEGKRYVVETKKLQFKKTKMYTYDCNIFCNMENIKVEKAFSDKVKVIMTPPEPVKPVVNTLQQHPGFRQPQFHRYDNNPPIKQRVHSPAKPVDDNIPWWKLQQMQEEFDDVNGNKMDDDEVQDLPLDVFIKTLFNFGTEAKKTDEIENLLDDIMEMEINGAMLASSIIDIYIATFEKCYPIDIANPKAFLEVGDGVIDILEEQAEQYSFLYQPIGAIKEMLAEYEELTLIEEEES